MSNIFYNESKKERFLDLKHKAIGWTTLRKARQSRLSSFVWLELNLLKANVNFSTDKMLNWNQRECPHINVFTWEVL